MAFARPSEDPKILQATSLVVRTKADLAAVQQKEQEDWKKRGAAGIVSEIDPAGQTLTLKAGQRTWKVQTSDKTQFHRYSRRFRQAGRCQARALLPRSNRATR